MIGANGHPRRIDKRAREREERRAMLDAYAALLGREAIAAAQEGLRLASALGAAVKAWKLAAARTKRARSEAERVAARVAELRAECAMWKARALLAEHEHERAEESLRRTIPAWAKAEALRTVGAAHARYKRARKHAEQDGNDERDVLAYLRHHPEMTDGAIADAINAYRAREEGDDATRVPRKKVGRIHRKLGLRE